MMAQQEDLLAVDNEVWRAVPRWLGYEISSHGRIKSVDRMITTKPGWRRFAEGRVLKPGLAGSRREYLVVNLYQDGERRTVAIHRLVARVFIGPCPPGMEVCHNDGNPQNNRADNLRYDTHKGNHVDRLRHGTNNAGTRNGGCKLTPEQVREIRKRYTGRGGETHAEIARFYGISAVTVGKIIRRTKWKQLP